MNITIIGSGVIGLSTAFYLSKEGHDITIVDRGDGTNNCSFGNAGYISPSHFIPLASPGIVAQGLKWMLSSTSPFYIKPRLDASLIKWGLKFYTKANEKTVRKNAPHLNNILQLSRSLMIDMNHDLDNGFQLETKGCLMLYRKASTGHHEAVLAAEAKSFGIEAPVLSKAEVQKMEPEFEMDVLGGVYFPIDCHLHPVRMMETLTQFCNKSGVKILFNHEVTGFEKKADHIIGVLTNKGDISTDQIIIAAGSWLPAIAQMLGISLLLQAGKGYSITYSNRPNNINYPAILVDDRVALTPMGKELRIGGTMEISGINDHVNMKRVKPIVDAANRNYTNLHLEVPAPEKVWSGLRPCAPDGLPYLGKSTHHSNVIVAGGHAMLGISMAAATGYLINQLLNGNATEIDINAFRIDR
ncbi:MAG: FAD-dependent oxidoreductase [Saprospiraceae bacterium]|nr:FAD-dependent oxidoreductase [Saprospiraceae bacterium]